MLIGYVRPTWDDINCEYQLQKLEQYNCAKVVAEDHSSAKRRGMLDTMIEALKPGDKVIVVKLFSLADSTRHLMELLEQINSKEASIMSITEGIDTLSRYCFSEIVKYLVDFQSDVTSEKTKEGINEARQKGIASGRPRKPDENVKRAIQMYQSKKYSLAEIKSETGISKSTLYRYLEH